MDMQRVIGRGLNFLPSDGSTRAKAAILLAVAALFATGCLVRSIGARAPAKRFTRPAYTQPQTFSPDGRLLVAANPDKARVSVFNAKRVMDKKNLEARAFWLRRTALP